MHVTLHAFQASQTLKHFYQKKKKLSSMNPNGDSMWDPHENMPIDIRKGDRNVSSWISKLVDTSNYSDQLLKGIK